MPRSADLPDLPRLVMRRAAVVAAAVLLLALVLGLWRVAEDVDEEADGAMVLASLVAQLVELPRATDRQALAMLREWQRSGTLRHLTLELRDQDGRLLIAPRGAESGGPAAAVASGAAQADGGRWPWSAPAETAAQRVSWRIARPHGGHWVASLSVSHDSERREALAGLRDGLLLLLLAVVALLAVMRWNVQRAFAPLGRLLASIERIEGRDTTAVQALPTMPTRELEALAGALRHLGAALDAAEAERRTLSQRVHSLQDDERLHLARELHDEFGQRLTALRVDAAWLARRTEAQPALQPVVQGMVEQCRLIQQDIRALLTRLQPFGPPRPGDEATGETLARLQALLQALVEGWQPRGDGGLQVRLDWSGPGDGSELRLPTALALALYRISQEALTNAVRHAQASRVRLRLAWRGEMRAGGPFEVDWQVEDDGIGLPQDSTTWAGNGLVGLRERVWAQGGELRLAPAVPGSTRPGLRLETRLAGRWLV